jgi:hypothetical protein
MVQSGIMESDMRHLYRIIRYNKQIGKKNKSELLGYMDIVSLNSNGFPDSLLGRGDHFDNCPKRNRTNKMDEIIPMDMILESICKQDLAHPMVCKPGE